jgi:hypothetical protein
MTKRRVLVLYFAYFTDNSNVCHNNNNTNNNKPYNLPSLRKALKDMISLSNE